MMFKDKMSSSAYSSFLNAAADVELKTIVLVRQRTIKAYSDVFIEVEREKTRSEKRLYFTANWLTIYLQHFMVEQNFRTFESAKSKLIQK